MIITCKNCAKKFNVDPNLIPEKGRLLQCNDCDHKWYFTKEAINETVLLPKTNKSIDVVEPIIVEPNLVRDEDTQNIELLDNQIKEDFVIEKISINENETNKRKDRNSEKNGKNYNILALIIVFIISFIALIIVLDTFQNPISKIFPNIELILYNLYETFNDINLFLRDLI